jgi:hypothetical protein
VLPGNRVDALRALEPYRLFIFSTPEMPKAALVSRGGSREVNHLNGLPPLSIHLRITLS